jgi:hypothetical protein
MINKEYTIYYPTMNEFGDLCFSIEKARENIFPADGEVVLIELSYDTKTRRAHAKVINDTVIELENRGLNETKN